MAVIDRTRAALARLFYRYFFSLLLVVASAAQWAVAAWALQVGLGLALPWWGHILTVAALYFFNRSITALRPRQATGAAFRAYTASAFVSLFCAAFLLAAAALWGLTSTLLGALSAQALTVGAQSSLVAGIDGAFRWVASLGMLTIALTMGYGYAVGQHQLRVTRTTLPLRGLGRPLRVAQISDIHVGQNLTMPQLQRFVDQVNDLEADLICVTGDIADSPAADYARFFPVLGELRARYGVCAILGNHDHYAGAQRVVDELQQWTRFQVLRDEAVTLDADGAMLHVIGLDDRGRDWARGVLSDARLADLLEAAPGATPVLLLVHRPDVFHQAAAAGVGLTLSGHTHGGQLAIPWFGGRRRNLAEFITAFDRGLYAARGVHLYVNCGLGVTGQRIRLFTPREISLFELQPA
ncbi:MAG: metallophosphoesterase [Candidatus Binatia bacterium]